MAKQQPLHPESLLVVGSRPHTAPVLPTGRGRLGADSSRVHGDGARPATSQISHRSGKTRGELLDHCRLEGVQSTGGFGRVLRSVGQNQPHDVMNQICRGGRATVDNAQFRRRFDQAVTPRPGSSSSLRRGMHASMSLSEVQRHLRDKIGGNLKTVIGAFRLFDLSGRGFIERREFRRVLDHYCLCLADKEFHRLWAHYSPSNASIISYDFFLDKLGFGDSRHSKIAPVCTKLEVSDKERLPSQTGSSVAVSLLPHRKLQALFHYKMCVNSTPVWQALQAFDPTQSGLVKQDVLRAVLESFIFPMKPCSFQKLTSRYGVKAAGPVRWKHFVGHFMSPISGGKDAELEREKVSEKLDPNEDTMELHNIHRRLKEIHRLLATKEGGSIARADLRYHLERPHGTHPRLSRTRIKELLDALDPEHAGVIQLARLERLRLTTAAGPDSSDVPGDAQWIDEKQQAADERQTTQWADKVSVASASTVEGLPLDKLRERLNSALPDLPPRDPSHSGYITLRRKGRPLSNTHDHRTSSVSRPGSCPAAVSSDGLCGAPPATREELRRGSASCRSHTERSGTPLPCRLSSTASGGDILSIVFQRVRSRLEQRRTSLSSRVRAVLRTADRDNRTLSEADVRKVLEDSWVVLDDGHFATFTELLGFRDGRIELSVFQAKYEEAIGRCRVQSPDPCPLLTSADECCAALRTRIRTIHGDNHVAFRLMDRNRRGVVGQRDFRVLHDSLRFLCGCAEYQRLLERVGLHTGATLNFAEFAAVVENAGKPARQQASVTQRLHELLACDARSKWASMSKVLCQTDGEGSTWIHKKSLRALLFSYALPLTPEQFDQLWSRFDPGGLDSVAACDFLETLGFRHGDRPRPGSCGDDAEPLPSDAASLECIQYVRSGCREHSLVAGIRLLSIGLDHHAGLSAALTRLGGDGTVTVDELRGLLHSRGCPVRGEQLAGLLDRLGVPVENDACGRLPYMDFLSAFSPATMSKSSPPPSPPDALRDIESLDHLGEAPTVARMRRLVSLSAPNLRKAFSASDRGRTGTVGALEFRRVLESFCARLSDRQFGFVLARLELDRAKGTVNWKDFLCKFELHGERGGDTPEGRGATA